MNGSTNEPIFCGCNLLLQVGENLYLNTKTADVNFVFEIDNSKSPIMIPAHKIILSAGSPVFEVMFFGSMPEKDDVKIVDASPEEFKEFLQLFYRVKVPLTSEHIWTVINLCKKYEVSKGLKLCQDVLKNILTVDNVCNFYTRALFLELENVVKHCEFIIKQNAKGILESSDLLDCDRNMLDKILQLIPSDCDASNIVAATMAWAKAECGRNQLPPTPANLRVQIDRIFDRIPFDKLEEEQFSKHMIMYNDFFGKDDLVAIILKSKRANKQQVQSMQSVLVIKQSSAPVIPFSSSTFYSQTDRTNITTSASSKAISSTIRTMKRLRPN